ncbi:hybrid sensor histidine kinase/response regulator [Comamonas thiooxydans]|uniref:hybrid sensor histidine kinase/response regulator n=1 Tax=Comamonas thiooxydans TaxID=363952 RepID=UPI0009EE30C2|nr:hybrid sensor histidine kinase/response regulator [Comamonas thiooxydans]
MTRQKHQKMVMPASSRLRTLFFGVFPAAIVLAGAVYWLGLHILQNEKEQLQADFSFLMGNINAQEQMLRTLRMQSQQAERAGLASRTSVSSAAGIESPSWRFFEGQRAAASMPFTLLCQRAEFCPVTNGVYSGAGSYLSDFYSTYWANLAFPAAPVFVVSPARQFSLSVPAVAADSSHTPLTRRVFLGVVQAIQQQTSSESPQKARQDSHTPIEWRRDADLPSAMIGLLPLPQPWDTDDAQPSASGGVYAATLFARDRISASERPSFQPAYDDFWLMRRDSGVLIGEGQLPAADDIGFKASSEGLILRLADKSGDWTAVYLLGYSSFIKNHAWLPVGALTTLLLVLAGGLGFRRWYRLNVTNPVQAAAKGVQETDAFNLTLLDTVPVGLCVLYRSTGKVAFSNELAAQWLGIGADAELHNTPGANGLLRQIMGTTKPGSIESIPGLDGRPLHVRFVPTRYKGQDVVLCAFADISARAEMERTQEQAKVQAQRAVEAKSTFLASMSHEIRTPLYGLLGTLEILAMTPLSEEQRRHIDHIQNSSGILQQLISDILDVTKIESGQLALEAVAFDPGELVQSAVASCAPAGEQKGLVVYSCVDTSVPACVYGDAARIRQILTNLLGNAIKFTSAGHVITRMRAESLPDEKVRLSLQVVDSGPGIGLEERKRLFEPFYQIDGGSHTVRGMGIGLALSAKLAKLMGSELHVTSEPGLGSSFSLDLVLEKGSPPVASAPQLRDITTYVRSPRKELSENLCQWLTRWGAQASALSPHAYPESESPCVLVDVMLDDRVDLEEWTGLRVVARGHEDFGRLPPQANRYSVRSVGFAIQYLVSGELEISPEPAHPPYQPLNLHILVAEDNPINQITLRDQLEQLGCQVTVAPDGMDALALWSINNFDLLLTDLNMPRMNGYELASSLRERGVSTPIIGVTANAMKEEETRCRAAGMNSWLVKPIDLRSLWLHLRAHAKASAEAPPPSGSDDPDDNSRRGPSASAAAIPRKYREVFIQTMSQDLDTLKESANGDNAPAMLAVLHRIRGGLSAVALNELLAQAEILENQIRSNGQTPASREMLTLLVKDMHETLDIVRSSISA